MDVLIIEKSNLWFILWMHNKESLREIRDKAPLKINSVTCIKDHIWILLLVTTNEK